MLKHIKSVEWRKGDPAIEERLVAIREKQQTYREQLAAANPWRRNDIQGAAHETDEEVARLERSLANRGWRVEGSKGQVLSDEFSEASMKTICADGEDTPQLVGENQDRRIWWFQNRLYESDPDLTADDVVALVGEAENRRRLKLETAHALQAMRASASERSRRQPIPKEVKLHVWQRDGGRCVECESQEGLEFDHVIPLAMGGSNTDRNLQLLCADCNRRKRATLG